MNLVNQHVVITGGTSGIGLEIVKQLNKLCTVIVIARQQDRLVALSNEFNNVAIYQVDLSDFDETANAAKKILGDFDRIDVLINNAAVQNTPQFLDEDFQVETIQREINVNLTSICWLSSFLLPALLKETRSIILNVNSGLGLVPKTSSAVYCATKGAVNIFSQSLGNQLASTNIRVIQAMMPLVETPMTAGRGSKKMPACQAARELINGIKLEIPENDIGKVKLLRVLSRLCPGIARNIMMKA